MKKISVIFAVLLFLTFSCCLTAQDLPAKVVLDKKQIRADADKVYENALLPATGGIEGSEGKEKVKLLFTDLQQISFSLAKHEHTAVEKSGKVHNLKFARIFSDRKEPFFRFYLTGQEDSLEVSSSEIKLIEISVPNSDESSIEKETKKSSTTR